MPQNCCFILLISIFHVAKIPTCLGHRAMAAMVVGTHYSNPLVLSSQRVQPKMPIPSPSDNSGRSPPHSTLVPLACTSSQPSHGHLKWDSHYRGGSIAMFDYQRIELYCLRWKKLCSRTPERFSQTISPKSCYSFTEELIMKTWA